MYGPHFLLFYGAAIIMTLAICWWKLRELESFSGLPPVPADPDPYEISYLLGSEFQVIRVVILDLIQRGYLQIDPEEQNIHRAPNSPDPSPLSEMEQSIYEWYSSTRTANEIFISRVPSTVRRHCQRYEDKLRLEGLLLQENTLPPIRKICIGGASVIIGLGGYKLFAAFLGGHYNVFFMILLGSFGVLALQSFWYRFSGRRISRRGIAYIKKLRQSFDVSDDRISALTVGGTDKKLLLLVGLFGVGVLAHTSLNYYSSVFQTGSRYIYGGGIHVVGGCAGGGGGGCGGCGGG